MLVFWKEKLVVLAVPKTGTTAMEKALGTQASIHVADPPELKHAPVYRYNRFFRPMFEKACKAHLETFALMREPVSWLGSWYRYRQRPFLNGTSRSTSGVSFDEFVLAYLENERPDFANVGSQAKFLEPRPNGTKVDFLFRYEDTPRWTAFLEERLTKSLSFEKVNTSKGEAPSLSARVEIQLRRKMVDDFDLWDSLGIDDKI